MYTSARWGSPGPKITPVPSLTLTISGSLSTTNVIMASWSRAMWQSVVNRAIPMLASGPFERHFFSAICYCRRKPKLAKCSLRIRDRLLAEG
ncbi:hypothetical protein KIN20_006845, partial [Parelaphostrongylus tenuis]